MSRLTASVVVFNSDEAMLVRTIQCFLGCESGDLYVVDNSDNDTARRLCVSPRVHYRHVGRNIGFGAAHNLVLREVLYQSEYHLVLNPDVAFDCDVLQKLLHFMDTHAQAGLVMPKVLYPDGRVQHVCKLLPTPMDLLMRRFSPNRHWTAQRNARYEMHFMGYDRIAEAPFLSGCFMFLRTSVLQRTGLFDERFFLYAEDIDLSRRIHRVAKTYFFPFASIEHVHAKGSYRNLRLMGYNIRSVVQYFNKWGWFFDPERDRINAAAGQIMFTHPAAHEEPPLMSKANS